MKRLAALFALLCLTLAPVGIANAQFNFFQDVCEGSGADSTACKDSQSDQSTNDNSITGPNGVISKATNIITLIVGIAAFIVIVVSGLQFILGVGDPARIANARNALIYAIVGIIIAVMAQVIVKFVVNKL
jgi:hypothetical protein